MDIAVFDMLREGARENAAVRELLDFAVTAGALAKSSTAGQLSEEDIEFLSIIEMADIAAKSDRGDE